jgi:DNA-binding Lrp family transcriptional regulator
MEVMVFAEISQMTQAAIEEFESAVVQFDEILEARRMFGTPDYLLRVTVPDHHAYEAFVTTKLSTVPHIARVVSHQTMKNLKHG